jgi:hypothetical protein
MAEGKKSFVLYCDQKEMFEHLPADMCKKLILHLFRYVNDENPQTDDVILNALFAPIKHQLKRDLEKWEKRAENSRENGKKGGRPITQVNPNKPSGLINNPDEPRKPVTVNGNVSVNDSDIKENKAKAFIDWFNKEIEKVKGSGNFRLTDKVKKQFNTRLKDGYIFKDFVSAFNSISIDAFHKENNYKYLTPEFITRADQIEKWCNVTTEKEKGKGSGGVSMEEMYHDNH